MALQGHGLLVEETDLRRAENLGDMSRREPVRLGKFICGLENGNGHKSWRCKELNAIEC